MGIAGNAAHREPWNSAAWRLRAAILQQLAKKLRFRFNRNKKVGDAKCEPQFEPLQSAYCRLPLVWHGQ